MYKIPVSRPSVGPLELRAIEGVLDSGWLGMGPKVRELEGRLGRRFGGREVICTNSGTAALHLALLAYDIGPGDEVIVPSLTYIASAQAIVATGATPVFCDVSDKHLLATYSDVFPHLTEHTKAIMLVHYCGQPCAMESFVSLAKSHNLILIEDAAHAFGSTYRKRAIGSFGSDAACFSFDPIKVMTCGEGGAVIVKDHDRAERVRQMRILGIDKDTWSRYEGRRSWHYDVVRPGFRYHMSDINAAIGLVQLENVDKRIRWRRKICKRYEAVFARRRAIRTLRANYDRTSPFMYVIRVDARYRDAFRDAMARRGVNTGIHYIPNHLHSLFRRSGAPQTLPVTEQAFREIVTLPLSLTSMADTERVIETVIASVREVRR